MQKLMKTSLARKERVLPPSLEERRAHSSVAIDPVRGDETVGEPVEPTCVSLDTWQIGGEHIELASPSLDGWQLIGG